MNPNPTVIIKDPPAKATTITLEKTGVKIGAKKVEGLLRKPITTNKTG